MTRVSGALLEARSAVAHWQQAQPGIAWWRSGRAEHGAELGAEGEAPLANSKQYHGACPVSRISRLKKCGRAVPRPVRGGSLISVTVRVREVRDRAPWSMRKSSGPVFSNLPSRGASEEGGAACSMLGAGGAERRRALPALRGLTRATLHTTHTHTPARMTATHRIGEARITVIGRHAVGRHAAEHVELPASSFR